MEFAEEMHRNACHSGLSKSLHGYLRESTEGMLQAALKEKVIIEEQNLQEKKVRN